MNEIKGDVSPGTRPQLTELQQFKADRAAYWLRAYEQEYSAQLALGSTRDAALSWVVGGMWHRLGEMLDVIDDLTGGDR